MSQFRKNKLDSAILPFVPKTDIICFTLLWVVYTILVIRFWFVTDDAFIAYRYAHNWATGEGIRYNLGSHTPVEGYSNFLWVAVCALFEYIGAEIKFWPLLVSFTSGSILLWMVFSTLRYRFELNLIISFVAAMFIAASPPFAVWSTSGLETMPFTLLLYATFDRLVLRKGCPEPISAGILGLALALIRIEGVIYAVLLALLAIASRTLVSEKYLRQILIYLGIVLIGFAIYWTWRYSYYYSFLPNTIYAKIILSTGSLKRGVSYVIAQQLSFLPMLLFLPGAVSALHRSRLSLGLPVAVMAISVILFSISVGGDFMAMGRFLIPGLPFTTLLIGWLLHDFYTGSTLRKYIVMAVALIVLIAGVLPVVNIHPVPKTIRQKFHFRHNLKCYHSEYEQWAFQKQRAKEWEIIGRTIKTRMNPSDTIVCGFIGAVGYYSELYIYDQNGLTCREVALRKPSGGLNSPGHDKRVKPEFFLEKNPTIIFFRLIPGAELEKCIREACEDETSSQYVADFVLVNGLESDEGPFYLFMVRRIREGIPSQYAWEKAYDALASL
jgi:hypothetical protein